ncbi:hypothetical protein WK25_03390 [Burkholderia latens]|nr:hypothetical protein WK25_03390 [Burkholderia latens]
MHPRSRQPARLADDDHDHLREPHAHPAAYATAPPSPLPQRLRTLRGIHWPDGRFALFVKILRNPRPAMRSACVFASD